DLRGKGGLRGEGGLREKGGLRGEGGLRREDGLRGEEGLRGEGWRFPCGIHLKMTLHQHNVGRRCRLHPLGEYVITLYANSKLRTIVTVTLVGGVEGSSSNIELTNRVAKRRRLTQEKSILQSYYLDFWVSFGRTAARSNVTMEARASVARDSRDIKIERVQQWRRELELHKEAAGVERGCGTHKSITHMFRIHGVFVMTHREKISKRI
nr:hypothetical protein [Tanacetum cinerariifolium]